MRFSSALSAYLIAWILALVVPVAALILTRKKRDKLSLFHFLLGMIFFIVILVVYYLILSRHLSASDQIGEYYNTSLYRTVVVSLITIVFAVLMYVFSRCVYIKKMMFRQNLSFFLGLGSGAVVLIGIFCFFMFIILIGEYFYATLLSYDTAVQAFYFSNDTYISVFAPIWGHVSYAVAGLCFLTACGCFGACLNQLAIRRGVPGWVSVLIFIGNIVGLCVMLNILIFMVMWNIPHYIMAFLLCLATAWMVFMVFLASHIKDKREEQYVKQFD